jgi:fumarylacetoacetate (FAA) hydrolase family protein
VHISTPRLGCLSNRVNTSDQVRPWTYGLGKLMRDVARRSQMGK